MQVKDRQHRGMGQSRIFSDAASDLLASHAEIVSDQLGQRVRLLRISHASPNATSTATSAQRGSSHNQAMVRSDRSVPLG